MSETKEEAALVGADALTQLTCSLVKSENCSAANGAGRHSKELHTKLLHSVYRQEEILGGGIGNSHQQALASVSISVSSPPACVLPRRQLSSSVDAPSTAVPFPTFAQAEVIEECLVVGTEESRPAAGNRPTTLTLSREVSATSSGGSGKTTPRNIPERPSGLPLQETLVASYPPASACRVSPMRHGAVAASSVQQQCPLDGDIRSVRRQAMARLIASRLGVIGDQITSEADMQNVTELLETIVSNASAWSWSNVARIFRALSHILAKIVSGTDSTAWEVFTDVWKHVLRNLFSLIADNGGWDSFIQWASLGVEDDAATPSHPDLPTSFTPDVPRRNPTDPVMRFSTPQVARRNFPTHHSTPSCLTSSRGNERGSRVLSLTEEGVFQMEAQVTFIAGEGAEQPYEEEENTFGSLSSFSDLSGSPTSSNPPTNECSPPEIDQSRLSAFDRSRSRSVPTRRRPNSARFLVRSTGVDSTQVIAEQDISMDSGLEAFSEASLNSADSCTSLNYSRLGVSAACILEAVRSMLIEK